MQTPNAINYKIRGEWVPFVFFPLLFLYFVLCVCGWRVCKSLSLSLLKCCMWSTRCIKLDGGFVGVGCGTKCLFPTSSINSMFAANIFFYLFMLSCATKA